MTDIDLPGLAERLEFAAKNTEGCLYSQRKMLTEAAAALRAASAPDGVVACRVMTPEEYQAFKIQGWHCVHKDYATRFISEAIASLPVSAITIPYGAFNDDPHAPRCNPSTAPVGDVRSVLGWLLDAINQEVELSDATPLLTRRVEAAYAALTAGEKAGAVAECCEPLDGEPSFVLLGRDPQAPQLVEQWADDRAQYEPDSDKPAKARKIAGQMRSFKKANPSLGMAQPTTIPATSRDRLAREALERIVGDEFSIDLEQGDDDIGLDARRFLATVREIARAALQALGGDQ